MWRRMSAESDYIYRMSSIAACYSVHIVLARMHYNRPPSSVHNNIGLLRASRAIAVAVRSNTGTVPIGL